MLINNDLKKQINSIILILQITKAMKLVAAVKLERVKKKFNELKPYIDEIYLVFNDILRWVKYSIYHEQSILKSSEKTCWLIINSDLGLCGAYNININKLVLKEVKKEDNIVGIGLKLESFYKKFDYNVINVYRNVDSNFSYELAQDIASELLLIFNSKKCSRIRVAYTKFINNITFKPVIFNLLPITKNSVVNNSNDSNYFDFNKNNNNTKISDMIIEFEPSAKLVFEGVIIMYLSAIIFLVVTESKMAEQASRRLAMENATNNASNMLSKLTLEYNKKRQAEITQEILETK